MRILISILALAASAHAANCPSGYDYYKTLTVQSGQVSGTLTNFRAVILNPASTSGKLATTGNGGHVTSSSGYDIVPSTTTGSMITPFELVSYTASTGALQMWVDVSSIADGTAIHLCYGKSGDSYHGSAASTWSGYALVSHAEDNAVSTVVVDSAGNWPGNAFSNTSTTTTAGKIGNALAYNSPNDFVNFGNVTQFNGATALTVNMWAYVTTPSSFVPHWAKIDSGANNGAAWLDTPNVFLSARNSSSTDGAATSDSPDTASTWHYLTYVFNGSLSGNARLVGYIDGVALNLSYTGTPPSALPTVTDPLYIGTAHIPDWTFFQGKIDDFQVIASAQSSSLVVSQYNNQSAPGNDGAAGFWSVSGESSTAGTSMSASPSTIYVASTTTLTLTGTGTSWSGSTVITATGVSGTTCGAVSVSSATAATISCTTGIGVGTLTLTESITGSTITTVTVAVSPIAVNSSGFYFSPGNWYVNGSTSAAANSAGAYLYLSWTGTTCTLDIDTSALGGNSLMVRWWVDGGTPTDVDISGTSTIVLYAGSTDTTHTATVIYRGRDIGIDSWTTPSNGLKVTGASIAGTAVAPSVKSNKILVFGDSRTEGARNLISGLVAADQDATATEAWAVARSLNAELGLIGFSSQGWTHVGDTNVPVFFVPGDDSASAWNKISNGHARSFAGITHVLVFGLGTNDSVGATVTASVSGWLAAARAAFDAGTKIILIPLYQGGSMGTAVQTGFTNYQTATPDANAYFVPTGFSAAEAAAFSGAGPSYLSLDGSHPSAFGESSVIAPAFIRAINSAIGGSSAAMPGPIVAH